jgi:hypothetical protein
MPAFYVYISVNLCIYLFISGSLNNAVSCLDYTALNDGIHLHSPIRLYVVVFNKLI